MNRSALIRATLIGTVLQLAMIIAGHFIPFVKDNVFMWGGMALSLVAGLMYAFGARSKLSDSLLGGAIAGAVCALIGIAVSVLLGDTPPFVLAAGTLMSAITGLIGGGIGKVVSTPKATT
jgi:hypothetical protein